ncbi:hypothetical protein [Methylocaldum sp.]|nr:hypothetical protein [Methylocaldum sp.]HYE37604.1 hypothetical protein [Methylocaldum sp.]
MLSLNILEIVMMTGFFAALGGSVGFCIGNYSRRIQLDTCPDGKQS